MVQMVKTYGSIAPSVLEDFESALGDSLPVDYKNFLLQTNGGIPVLREFLVPQWGSSAVHVFFGFQRLKADDLNWNLDQFDDLVDSGVIPIGTDPSGNRICLGFSKEANGKIYFWDHEGSSDELIFLSESFSDFVAGLLPEGSVD